VHEHNDRHVSERLMTDGTWEPFETELIRRFLLSECKGGERPLFIDCGANLGWYSVIAGALGAEVVAFEPMPANAALLRENVTRNRLGDRVEVHEVALGSGEGAGVLRLSVDNQGDHRLIPCGVTVEVSRREEVTVKVRALDDVVSGRLPTLIKLDTQGSEVAILRGGRRTWSRPDVVIVLEFWPYGLQRCGASAKDLLTLLGDLVGVSHSCFDIVEWRQRLVPLTMLDLEAMAATGGYSAETKGFTNIVLVPDGHVELVRDLIVDDQE
jgi:FkbM family methyltransferase